MRSDIAFDAGGTTLRGWLYLPDNAKTPFPAIVMAHGWGAVKELYLDIYAESFAKAGFAVLVYDHPNFGASDGLPRQEIDPWLQIHGYRHAITYARTRDEIDGERIGIWGTSYTGGHVLVVGAVDRRVKCIVSQCPTISGFRNTLRRAPADELEKQQREIDADRQARFGGAAPVMVPLVPGLELPTAQSGRRGADAIKPFGNDGAAWFGNMRPDRLAMWRNEMTLQSVDLYTEYEPGAYMERISPTPLLVITADNDARTPTDEILAVYQRAREPKRLLIQPGGHYDLYGTGREAGVAAACEWFRSHLGSQDRAVARPSSEALVVAADFGAVRRR
jgi:uncharacterized protein